VERRELITIINNKKLLVAYIVYRTILLLNYNTSEVMLSLATLS